MSIETRKRVAEAVRKGGFKNDPVAQKFAEMYPEVEETVETNSKSKRGK